MSAISTSNTACVMRSAPGFCKCEGGCSSVAGFRVLPTQLSYSATAGLPAQTHIVVFNQSVWLRMHACKAACKILNISQVTALKWRGLPKRKLSKMGQC
jgi:hypothetical protein